MSNTPRIYVACLAAYNNARLHGEWIDLDRFEDVPERIQDILKSSPEPDAEEWAVHDHEYCGNLGEYPGLKAIEDIQSTFAATERNYVDWEPFIAFCDHLGEPISKEQIFKYQEQHAGSADSLEVWCEMHIEETGQLSEIPENLQPYFNFEALARDMEINDVFTIQHDNQTLVFWHS